LYACENEFVTLKQKHGMRKYENRLLREILGPKSDKVAKDWGNVHNEKVRNFCSSSNAVRMIVPSRPPYVFMVVEIGCQDKTIKQIVMTFLIGEPGFRLSDQMRNEDARTRLNVKKVNEMTENERKRNCTHTVYLRTQRHTIINETQRERVHTRCI
jgi:stage III sporulation protein SpoIIIAA